MKRQIEIFTANCPVCDPVVQMVKDLACDNCEVTAYDLVKQCEDKTCLSKVEEYGVKRLPAIVVNGKLLDCCQISALRRKFWLQRGLVNRIRCEVWFVEIKFPPAIPSGNNL